MGATENKADSEPKKRGRKRKNDLYFGPEQEEAVVRFLQSDDQIERNMIYNKFLYHPINKMVESIIRTYGLHRKGISFEESHTDTISFLITKAAKFEPSKGKKAYSYYGTIVKNYLIGILQKDDRNLKQFASFDENHERLESNGNLSYSLDGNGLNMKDFINKIIIEVEAEMLDTNPDKKKLTDNEIKVGYCLIDILEQWETCFDDMKGGAKYNKNQWLETMRNCSRLSTKDIRVSMKRYRMLYDILKFDGLEDGFEENPYG
tara:strand:- start:389 stop:1174 length:786 start_codon:yes stop_codon:yes gene_type:complete